MEIVAPITIRIPRKNGTIGFFDGITILATNTAGSHKNTPAHQAISKKPSITSATNKPIATSGIIIFPAVVENQSGASSTLTPPAPGCFAYATCINPAPKQKIKNLISIKKYD